MNADGSGSKQLTFSEKNDYTPNGSSANAPVWSAEGKIAYWSGIEGKYGQIWVMDGDGKRYCWASVLLGRFPRSARPV